MGGPIGSGGRGVAIALAAALEACAMPAKVLHLSDFVNDPPPPRGFAPVSDHDDDDDLAKSGEGGNPALRRLERSVAAAGAAFEAAAAASAAGSPNGHGSGGGMGMSIDTAALAAVVAQALASASATGLRCLIIEGVAALDPSVRGRYVTFCKARFVYWNKFMHFMLLSFCMFFPLCCRVYSLKFNERDQFTHSPFPHKLCFRYSAASESQPKVVDLSSLGLAHLPAAAILAAPLQPLRMGDLSLLGSSDLRLLRALAHASHDQAPVTEAAAGAASMATTAAPGAMTTAESSPLNLASRVLKAWRRAGSVEATHVWGSPQDVQHGGTAPVSARASWSAVGLLVVDTAAAPFEGGLLRRACEGLLRSVPPHDGESATAQRLLTLLQGLDPLPDDLLPSGGLLRTFAAGNNAL